MRKILFLLTSFGLFGVESCVTNPNPDKTKEMVIGADSYGGVSAGASPNNVKSMGSFLTLDNYLRRVSGVSVNGEGATAQVTIRGVNTIRSGTEPLFIVNGNILSDGYAGAFQMVTADDISSVTVLKDASSTSIYGSRGANGVIIINLKKKN
jgi:TonB-dependent SusC/RagA subfamily outer membrane receptor